MERDVRTLAVPLGFSSENTSLSTDLPLFKADFNSKPLEKAQKSAAAPWLSSASG